MQTLGAYSMQATTGPTAAIERISTFKNLTEVWLARKGADVPEAVEGEFKSLTGDGTGLFSRTVLKTAVGELHELYLAETASNGDLFTTRVSLSHFNDRITVYATLGSAPKSVSVTDGGLHVRCPSIVRSLIKAYDDWTFNEYPLPNGQVGLVDTEEEALDLCDELRWEGRSLPTIVVSKDSDGTVWPKIADELAIQLVGLAEVVEIGREAAWVVTDEIKKSLSCYRGAVRLYWPGIRQGNQFRSQLWTSDRQIIFGKDDIGKRRFLSMIRKTVLTAAALTIPEPRDMQEVRRASSKERLETEGVDALKAQVLDLQERNAELDAHLATANIHLASMRYEFDAYKERYGSTDGTETTNEEAVSAGPPTKGETRFYKKISTGGGIDRMVYRRKPCNHNSWTPAFAGDQAEKGISKLEGQKHWKSLWKCSGCTNGGFWKVCW